MLSYKIYPKRKALADKAKDIAYEKDFLYWQKEKNEIESENDIRINRYNKLIERENDRIENIKKEIEELRKNYLTGNKDTLENLY